MRHKKRKIIIALLIIAISVILIPKIIERIEIQRQFSSFGKECVKEFNNTKRNIRLTKLGRRLFPKYLAKYQKFGCDGEYLITNLDEHRFAHPFAPYFFQWYCPASANKYNRLFYPRDITLRWGWNIFVQRLQQVTYQQGRLGILERCLTGEEK